MKKLVFIFIFFILIIFSCLHPEKALGASKQGILVWFNQILPSLLPFSILSGILFRSKFVSDLGDHSHLFSILLTLVCGFIFGFPIGAKLATDFYSQSLLSRRQATILCITANNFSTMYVCGYVLPTLFPDQNLKHVTYLLLYITPFIACILLLIFCRQTTKINTQKKSASRFQLDMQIIDAGIISGFEALIKICGYIVLFSLITQLICHYWYNNTLINNILLGNLEITNGIQQLQYNNNLSQPTKYIIAIQLLSFGGISGLTQTASIMKSTDLSIKSYAIGKLILSIIITICTIFFIL